MKYLICFFMAGIAYHAHSQCDCEVFSKKMQEYRVKNYELSQHLEGYKSLDSTQQIIIEKQRAQIIYLKSSQDSLASIPRPLLNHKDEAFYLSQLRTYYLHTGDSAKAAQVKVIQMPEDKSTKPGN